jgi:hypothetical protein
MRGHHHRCVPESGARAHLGGFDERDFVYRSRYYGFRKTKLGGVGYTNYNQSYVCRPRETIGGNGRSLDHGDIALAR